MTLAQFADLANLDVEVVAGRRYLIGVKAAPASGMYVVRDGDGNELHRFSRVWEDDTRETFVWRPDSTGRAQLHLSGNGVIGAHGLTAFPL